MLQKMFESKKAQYYKQIFTKDKKEDQKPPGKKSK